MAGVGDGVGQRPQVVRAERGPHRAVVVVEQPDAALVVGVGLVLVLEHRDRPALGPGVHGLGVPVGALDQPDGDRPGPLRRPGDRGRPGRRGCRAGRPGSTMPAGEVGELVLGQQLAEQLEREVLGVVVLHVDVDEGAPAPRAQAQDRAQPRPWRSARPLVAAERLVVGGQRGGLDADVDPGQRPEVVALEAVVGRPAGAPPSRSVAEQLGDPGRRSGRPRAATTVFSPSRSTVKALPASPQLRAAPRRPRPASAPTMNCCGHPRDVAPGHAGLDLAPEGHAVGHVDAQVERRGRRRRPRSTRRGAGRRRRRRVMAGNTSTKRNSWVLNSGRAIAQSSIRSLHHDMRKTRDRSPAPSSAMRRARATVSRSIEGRIRLTVPTARPLPGHARGDATPPRT